MKKYIVFALTITVTEESSTPTKSEYTIRSSSATNLLYEDELKVRSIVTYKDENIVKMQIALEGVQTRCSTGTLTKGTNIIVSANIEVDKYTPSRVDQIRMYYFNEGVTNYESQTKWTVKTDIPTGILKTTNGFDVAVFNYQAPTGLVTVNEIENYDGQILSLRAPYAGVLGIAGIGANVDRLSTDTNAVRITIEKV